MTTRKRAATAAQCHVVGSNLFNVHKSGTFVLKGFLILIELFKLNLILRLQAMLDNDIEVRHFFKKKVVPEQKCLSAKYTVRNDLFLK